MLFAILTAAIPLFAALGAPAASGLGSDSLILKEIADSLKVGVSANTATVVNGRVTRLSIYYQGQRGDIPAALGGLDSLRRLFIAITRVTGLPKEIGRLRRLDSIDISTSGLGPTLPAEIGDLPALRFLRVTRCNLRSLPASLMKLRTLEAIDFSGNSICHVEDSLRHWILAISPDALDDQNRTGCVPTGIIPGRSGSGARAGTPVLGLYLPGRPLVPPDGNAPGGGFRYYSPIGRRLIAPRAITPSAPDP